MARTQRLNQLQENFCNEYLEDFDDLEAVRRAGYRYNSDADLNRIAGGLLRNPTVQQRIAELQLERAPLTEMQKRAARYFVVGGCTQTEACRKAGYKGNDATLWVTASRLFSRPMFKRYLVRLNRMLIERYMVDHDWVFERAKEWIDSSNVQITDVAVFRNGRIDSIKDLSKLPPHVVRGIKKIRQTETTIGEDGTRIEYEIEMRGPERAALALIARHIGFGNDYNAALNTLHRYGYEVKELPDGTLEGRPFDAPLPDNDPSEGFDFDGLEVLPLVELDQESDA
jgi:phage terminase small subunit